MNSRADTLLEKIQSLSANEIVEVEHFVEFVRLNTQQRELTRATTTLTAPVFEAIWNNAEDAAYDAIRIRRGGA